MDHSKKRSSDQSKSFCQERTLSCQIRTARCLLGRVFSKPTCGNTDGFGYMYLCHKCTVQQSLQASFKKFEIHPLGLSQFVNEKPRPNKQRAVLIWQVRVINRTSTAVLIIIQLGTVTRRQLNNNQNYYFNYSFQYHIIIVNLKCLLVDAGSQSQLL